MELVKRVLEGIDKCVLEGLRDDNIVWTQADLDPEA